MTAFMNKFFACERGATAIEYALLSALIAVGLITALGTVSTRIKGTYAKIANALPQ
ncbi:Flp family type IVb pilin [Phenylobacterium conjunctum]|jgi:pilus assembly protein Flp/PilA|uniref:Flp family type IVb pilin n=1 Tax=Phenylobacterium conjunctum TaxID=1298959 RepID=A0ABW3T4A1_9CAUL